jgi:CarD family transcriptional regulator
MVQKKSNARKLKFRPNEFVVYPAHGVGKIVDIEEQEIAGCKLELYVIDFEKEKMRLRVPIGKCDAVGMRKLTEKPELDEALNILRGRARVKRTMWSRRAQEYEAKINSGDIMALAEVVRDLYRSDRQPEQSYSERQLFEAALDRFAREVAAVKKLAEAAAVSEIEEVLEGSSTRRSERAAELEAAQNEAAEKAA